MKWLHWDMSWVHTPSDWIGAARVLEWLLSWPLSVVAPICGAWISGMLVSAAVESGVLSSSAASVFRVVTVPSAILTRLWGTACALALLVIWAYLLL
jgi:hypothetical protein